MIKPLTSLRFFFALMVFMSHLDFINPKNIEFHNLHKAILQEGFLGVSFFFILSGFVLSLSYEQRLIEKKISLKEFYVARFARIYPLHLLTLIIAIPLALDSFLINKITWFVAFILNLLLLQSFVPVVGSWFSFNSPSWSISDEAFFYLMFPFIISIFYKYKGVSYWILFLIVLFPIGLYFTPSKFHWIFDVNPFFRIIDFLIGILLYQLYQRLSVNRDCISKLQGTLSEILALVLFTVFLLFHKNVPVGYRASCFYWIPMCCIILVFAFSKGVISEFISKKGFVLLGEISFSFYLIHYLTIKYVAEFNSKFQIISNDYILIAVIFCIAMIISYLSHYWVERPVNKYIKARFIR